MFDPTYYKWAMRLLRAMQMLSLFTIASAPITWIWLGWTIAWRLFLSGTVGMLFFTSYINYIINTTQDVAERVRRANQG